LILDAESLSLNIDAQGGEVRVQVANEKGEPIPGFRFQDGLPITSDSLDAPVKWEQPLSKLRGQTVRLEVQLRNARLFAFTVQ